MGKNRRKKSNFFFFFFEKGRETREHLSLSLTLLILIAAHGARLVHPLVVGLAPAPRLHPRKGQRDLLQSSKKAFPAPGLAVVAAGPPVEQRVPHAADDGVVALERRAVVRAVRLPGNQNPRIL